MKNTVDWSYHDMAQRASGMTVGEYCALNGLSSSSFNAHRHKLKRGKKTRFASVVPKVEQKESRDSVELTLKFDSSGKVRISGVLPSVQALREVVGALT